MPRSRLNYASLATLTLLCGLATRPLRGMINPALAENLGDGLWAMLVYWLLALVWRRQPAARIALAAITISTGVECSQLCRTPWLDAIRRTLIGGLILGWGFAWGDLLAYACGVILCFIVDRWLTRPCSET